MLSKWFSVIKLARTNTLTSEKYGGSQSFLLNDDIIKVEFDYLEEREANKIAKQYVIDTANELDYVKIEGDRVLITPEWIFQPKGQNWWNADELQGYYFFIDSLDWTAISSSLGICLRTIASDRIICLDRKNRDPTPIGDAYVTLMLMASTERQWLSLWGLNL
jgi:hypothetical protein